MRTRPGDAGRPLTGSSGHTAAVRWRSYEEMSRLEQKMFWAVREEAMLHDLPVPEVDDPGSVHEVRWPAERPAECAAVLLAWFDAGLIDVMTTDSQQVIGRVEAREVLADHAAWGPTHSLVLTDAGEEALA